jgi:hypothetical protein
LHSSEKGSNVPLEREEVATFGIAPSLVCARSCRHKTLLSFWVLGASVLKMTSEAEAAREERLKAMQMVSRSPFKARFHDFRLI